MVLREDREKIHFEKGKRQFGDQPIHLFVKSKPAFNKSATLNEDQ